VWPLGVGGIWRRHSCCTGAGERLEAVRMAAAGGRPMAAAGSQPLLEVDNESGSDDSDAPESGAGAILKSLVEVSPFFFLAGMGMVASGALLSYVSENLAVFHEVPSLLLLVPALLGLKGNLEMTLGARLGSHANKKELRGATFWPIVRSNLMAIQCQAIIVGAVASMLAIVENYSASHVWNLHHNILLACSAIGAASLASLLLSVLMIAIVVCASKRDIDPDNISAPIAGMLGDFVTLGIVVLIAKGLWALPEAVFNYLPVLLVGFMVLAVICFRGAFSSKYTKEMMTYGWLPVIASMFLSNLSGPISQRGILRWKTFAKFQVVMNGAGGNLGAIFCCKLSSDLFSEKEDLTHKLRPMTLPSPYRGLKKRLSRMGHAQRDRADTTSLQVRKVRTITEEAHMNVQTSWVAIDKQENYVKHFLSFKAIFGQGEMSRFGRMLLMLIVPGQAVFACIVVGAASSWSHLPCPLFVMCFIFASFAQVTVLLMASRQLVVMFWRSRIDPDNGCSPLICGLGDLMGTSFLFLAYWVTAAFDGQAWPGKL